MTQILTNPAAAASRQQVLPFSRTEVTYWNSLPVIRYERLQGMLDALLDYDDWMDPDPYRIAIPVCLNRVPMSCSWFLWDLLTMTPEDLWPAARTGVMTRFARSILKGIPTRERSTKPWGRSRLDYDECLPPWISNRKTLDTLERSIRMVVWESFPELLRMVEAEKRLTEASSRAFLKTGYYAYEDSPERLPRHIRESSELMDLVLTADDALATWYGTDIDKLLEAMLLPRSLVYSGDEPIQLCPESAEGKMLGPVPDLGLTGDDVASIVDHIHDERRGWKLGSRDDLPTKCRPHFDHLMQFVVEAERRERLQIVEG